MGHVGSNKTLPNANPVDVSIVDGNGDQITSFGGGTGGTAHTDDSAFSIGSAASITPAGFLADEVAPDSVDEGDVGVARMTLNRLQLTVISDPVSEKRANIISLTDSNSLAVAIVDGNGDQITAFGAGTQYIEDAAAAANPTGTVLNLVRNDARSGSLVSTDGDNIAARGTNNGELYVKHVDVIPINDNSGSLTVDGSVTVTQATGSSLHTVVDSGTITTITNVVHVDDNSGSLTVDNASLSVLAGAVFNEDTASANADPGIQVLAVQKATPADTAGTDGDYQPLQMKSGRLWSSAVIDTALPAGTNVIGHVIVDSGNVGDGKSHKTKTGSASATFTLVTAVSSKKLKVYGLSLMTASTSAVTITFKDGASGTALGTYILQAITGTNFGIAENVAVPSSLFETTAGNLLEMSFSASVSVTYNVRFWDDDAS